MAQIIKQENSIIIACDVAVDAYERILRETADLSSVGGYKLGCMLGLAHGLPRAVELARRYTDKPLIYDHQKAGTDIPEMGDRFAKVCKDAGVDAVILFPQSGPETEKTWIRAAREVELGVIVGGLMSHPHYTRSEGGFIDDSAILEMYAIAAGLGVTDFVVPSTKPDSMIKIKRVTEEKGIASTFYVTGLGAQGGEWEGVREIFGNKWHAIVGRGVYGADNIKGTARAFSNKIAA